MKDTKSAYLRLADQFEPEVARAFELAIADLVASAQIGRLEAALAARDVDAAIAALNLAPEFFAPVRDALLASYAAGGQYQIATQPRRGIRVGRDGPIVVRWDGRSLVAEAWARDVAGKFIVEMAEGQVAMVRAAIEEGLQSGINPRTIALDLVGRIQGGKRVGGVLGLTEQQRGWARDFRAALDDPSTARAFLRRQRGRFVGVKGALGRLSRGEALTPAEKSKLADRYRGFILRYRGETIARSETIPALNAGRFEATDQMMARANIPSEFAISIWHDSGDDRVRDDHEDMDKDEVPFGTPFEAPDGSLLRYPGDTELGASAEQTIQCRCYVEIRIDYARMAA